MKARASIALSLLISLPLALRAETAPVPAGIDHDPWDALLRKYVSDSGMVDYKAWADAREDRARLRNYLEQFAPEPEVEAAGDERIASLINAYNAYTIRFILRHYPTKSIRLLDSEFTGDRYELGGKKVSAEDIELVMLREAIGWKMHSVVVCAARSCPPLLNRAYRADDWERKMRERYRVWLRDPDLNAYYPEADRVAISKVFKWHDVDFEGEGKPPIANVLARFGPEKHRGFLRQGDYDIDYMDYHWGLNAQSDLGKDYEHNFLKGLF